MFTSNNHATTGLDVFETETGTEIKLGAEFPVFPHKLTAVITTEDSVEYSPRMFMNRYAMHYLDFCWFLILESTRNLAIETACASKKIGHLCSVRM